jgi:alpha-amylase/alpha-mannosidase (GH57 family)
LKVNSLSLVWRSDQYSYSEITPFSHDLSVVFVGFTWPSSVISDFSYTLYETAIEKTGSLFTVTPSAYDSHFTVSHGLTSSDGSAAPSWISMTLNTDDFKVSVSSTDY